LILKALPVDVFNQIDLYHVPMVAYGNVDRYTSSKIRFITLGYNPVPTDAQLGGCKICFQHFNEALLHERWSTEAREHCLSKQSKYFENAHLVEDYFNPLSALLVTCDARYQEITSEDYTNNISLHLDLIPFSTLKPFGKLSTQHQQKLLTECCPLLMSKLECLLPHALICCVSESILQVLFPNADWITLTSITQKERTHILRAATVPNGSRNLIVYSLPSPQSKPLIGKLKMNQIACFGSIIKQHLLQSLQKK